MKTHSIRLIAGRYKGRKLSVINSEGLRPTTDRVRETLFNWLTPYIRESLCLDLFAGSGALGIEAISRGAKHSTFVENNSQVYKTLTQNLHFVDKSLYQTHRQDAQEFLKSSGHRFDLIFFDPPYQMSRVASLLKEACQCITPNGLLYIESNDETLTSNPHLQPEKTLRTKNICCGLYRFRPDASTDKK
jgi:16S rRNA (guanine966-N2)-methyltransferase